MGTGAGWGNIMGVRQGVGGVRSRGRLTGGVLVAALVVAACLAGTRPAVAGPPGHALAYHATVLNGEVVGSAFQIGPRLAVTNAHVVAGLGRGDTLRLVASSKLRRRVDARLIAVSQRMDLALLEVPKGFLPVVPGRERQREGEAVVAAGVDASGQARGLPRLEIAGHIIRDDLRLPGFGAGMVARVPGVRPGFSGGPLLDARGRLLGMIAAIRPGPAASAPPATAASGFAPVRGRPRPAEEAFVLGAAEIRAETARLLASASR